MMPQTVPNSPMNGVMLAVVARKPHAPFELGHLDGRRPQQRAVDGVQALEPRTTGRGAGRQRLVALRVAAAGAWRSCAFSSA